MYHLNVEHKLRFIVDAINARDIAPILDGLADKFSYRFMGDTCLGGGHRRRAALAYSASSSPEPPNAVGKSLNFGRPSLIGRTFSE